MPVSRRDIQVIRGQQAKRYEPTRTFEPGVLVEIDGSVEVAGRPGYSWCREFNNTQLPPFQILNRRVPNQAGWKVKIGYPEKPPFDRQVVDVWGGFGGLPGYDPIVIPTTGSHGQLHQYPSETSPGVDRVLVFQPAIQMLKGLPIGGFVIQVLHLEYWSANQKVTFTGGTVNLSLDVPATPGDSVWVLIYLNRATGLLAKEVGVVSAGTPVRPALPENAIPSVLVLLTNGQTEVTTADIEDARFFLSAAEGTGGYPFVTITVDVADTDADFNNLSDAIAAAVSGDVIEVGPGTYAADVVLPNGVSVIGRDVKGTILTGAGTVIELEGNNTLKNLQAVTDGGDTAVWVTGDNCLIQNVRAVADNGAGVSRAFYIQASQTRLLNCYAFSSGGVTSSYALAIDVTTPSAPALVVEGGRFDGATADIIDEATTADSVIHLIWPVAVNGTITGNEITGARFVPDGSGGLIVEGGGLTTTLDGLSDVVITTPADEELLAFDSGSGDWINQTAAELGLAKYSDAAPNFLNNLKIGTSDTGTAQVVTVAGAAGDGMGGGPTGGSVRLETSADYDDSVEYWEAKASGEGFVIGYQPSGGAAILMDVAANVTMPGRLTVNGGVIFNENGADVDFRVEGDSDANLLFADASTDRVGIGKNTPGTLLDVAGVATFIGITNDGTTVLPPKALTLVNGDNDDIALPTGATVVRATGPTTTFAISGFTGGVDGRVLLLNITVTPQMTIENNNAGSTSGNRIFTMAGDVVIPAGAGKMLILIYDGPSNAWRLFSARSSAGAF